MEVTLHHYTCSKNVVVVVVVVLASLVAPGVFSSAHVSVCSRVSARPEKSNNDQCLISDQTCIHTRAHSRFLHLFPLKLLLPK